MESQKRSGSWLAPSLDRRPKPIGIFGTYPSAIDGTPLVARVKPRMPSSNEHKVSVFSHQKGWDVFRVAKMAAQTFLGRLVYHRPPPLAEQNFLNLCCGPNCYPGWINADFYFSKSMKIFRPKEKKPNWRIDLRSPLRCPDGVIDGVFSEHTLEHINFADARRLLSELHRVMKPGAAIRIAVPDLEKYVDFYGARGQGEFQGLFSSGAEAIAYLTQDHYHLSVWDYELLARELASAGFADIAKCAFGAGQFKPVLKDDPKHVWETLYVEARKPG